MKGAKEAVLENVAQGVFQLPRSATAVRRILRKYSDVPADLADACLIQLAEELDTGEILTLDRDFQIYRWGRGKPFRLLVPL